MLQAVVCKGQAGAMLKSCRRQMRAAVAAWSTLACQHLDASVHLEPNLPMPAPHTCPKTGAELHLFCTVYCNCSASLLNDGMMTAHGCHGVVAGKNGLCWMTLGFTLQAQSTPFTFLHFPHPSCIARELSPH